jgi:hypothetical protein
MADERPTDRTEAAAAADPTTCPPTPAAGEMGCCFLPGQTPFQTTFEDCVHKRGGKWQPGPCPSQPTQK